MKTTKRIISILLCLCMVLQYVPVTGFAAEEDGLCVHHTEHTAVCHYEEGIHECHFQCEECAGEEPETSEVPETTAAPETEEVVLCTCESGDEDVHAPFCPLYVMPEDPQCLCAEKCTEETVNLWCDVCYTEGPQGCLGSEDAALYGRLESGTSYTFQDGVLTVSGMVEMWDFDDMLPEFWEEGIAEEIVEIIVGNSMLSIGRKVFANLPNLKKVTIGCSIAKIADNAFIGCPSIEQFYVNLDSTTFHAIDGNLYTADGKTLVRYASGKTETTFRVPETVTTIGVNAFDSCGSLKTIEFPCLWDGSVVPEVSGFNVTVAEHDYSGSWVNTDPDTHWKQCACGSKGYEAAHDFDKTICRTCSYQMACTCNVFCIPGIQMDESCPRCSNGGHEDCRATYIGTGRVSPGALWMLDRDGRLEINGIVAMKDYDETSPPWIRYKDCITSVEISASMLSIGRKAFADLPNLKLVIIGPEIAEIAEDAFNGCPSIEKFQTFSYTTFQSIDGNLYTADGKTLVRYASGKTEDTFVLSHDVTAVWENAFDSCGSLKNIMLNCRLSEADISPDPGCTVAKAEDAKFVNGFCPTCGRLQEADQENGVYQIGNAGQLIWFAKLVNGGDRTANAVLTADIDLQERIFPTICSTGLYYNTTTYTDKGYEGTFDGAGHSISNFTVQGISGANCTAGIFGTLSGTVKNLGVENMTFDLNGAADVRAAAIAGQMLDGSLVENCYVIHSDLTPGSFIVGGIAGCNYAGTIRNCFTYNVAIQANDRCGNLVSDLRGDRSETDRCGSVINCYTDAGRIVGTQNGGEAYIQNASTMSASRIASGEVAYLLNGGSSEGFWKQNGEIPGFTGETVYRNSCGGTVFYGITEIHSEAHLLRDMVCAICGSYDSSALVTAENREALGLDESYEGYCIIDDVSDLFWIGSQLKDRYFTSFRAVLVEDIEITEQMIWEPIVIPDGAGNSSILDGRGHTITINQIYEGTGNFGIFANGNYSYFRDLILRGSIQTGTSGHVGALVGSAYATELTNIISYVSITGTGTGNVGGLAGYFGGNASGHTSRITNCAVYGDISSGGTAGGILGCIWTGKQTTAIANAAYAGDVRGNSYTGAIVGRNGNQSGYYSTIVDSFFLEKDGAPAVGGGNSPSTGNVQAVTAEQFASGEVAYLLNGDQSVIRFRQTIGTDPYPTFTGGQVYYACIRCDGLMGYTNTAPTGEIPGHCFDNGFCTVCDQGYQPCEGSGTLADPYEIGNAGQLYWFAAQVNGGQTGICGVLTADITVNTGNLSYYNGTRPNNWRVWTPIGNKDEPYGGSFDGKGYTVSGLYFNDPTVSCVGMFGYISKGDQSELKNLTVANSYFCGKNFVGGIAGSSRATILSCTNSSIVRGEISVGGIVGDSNGFLDDCTNNGSVSGMGEVGGIAGYADAFIEYCTNNGDVNGTAADDGGIGGIVGVNCRVLQQCTNTGNVTGAGDNVGGICGQNDGGVSNCTNSGNVSGNKYVGGIVGMNTSFLEKVTNSGTVSGNDNVGGVAGHSEYEMLNCTNSGAVTGNKYVGGVVGFLNGDASDCTNSGDISGIDYVGGVVGLGYAQVGSVVGPVASTVNRCTNSGMVSGDSTVAGIAGIAETVKNCTNSGNVSGTDCVAGVCSQIAKHITQCTNSGDVTGNDLVAGVAGIIGETADNCSNSGNVSGHDFVGGVVGLGYELLTNLTNSGNVSGNDIVGGIAALFSGKLIECSNSGNVSGTDFVAGMAYDASELDSCINVSAVVCTKSSGESRSIARDAKCSNCYYLDAVDGIPNPLGTRNRDISGQIEAKTAEAFASGEVAWLLNGGNSSGTWGQEIGTDPIPVCSGPAVYKVTDCVGNALYSNREETTQHGNATRVAGQAVTCVRSGWMDHFVCPCGKLFADAGCTLEITDLEAWKLGEGKIEDPLAHDLSNVKVTKAATCTEPGIRSGKCPLCKQTFSEEIPALGHSIVKDPAVAPGCTVSGLESGSHCETCGEVMVKREMIPALGHDFYMGECIICGELDKADFTVFAGKSLTLKYTDPETGKALTSKQIQWALTEEYAPYATLTAAGKLTAKKVVDKSRVVAIGRILGAEDKYILRLIDIYPVATQLEIRDGSGKVNGKTIALDQAGLTLTADLFPLDAMQKVTWTVSDKKSAYATYEITDNALTVASVTGKSGTVTVKVNAADGSKKSATVKLVFGTLAENVTIGYKDGKTVIQGESAELVGGKSLQLVADVTCNEEGKTPSSKKVTWSILKGEAFATVSASGKITAKNVNEPQTVLVRAVAADGSGAEDTFQLNLQPARTDLLLLKRVVLGRTSDVTGTTIATDTTGFIALRAVNQDGTQVKDVTWKLSSSGAVMEGGVVTFTKAGTVTVTAIDGKRTAKVTLKVSDLADSVEINGTGFSVASGKSITLTGTAVNAQNKKVTWSIVEGGEFAKITAAGKLTATKDLTAQQKVTVRATAADGSGKFAQTTVTVYPLAQGVQVYSRSGGRTVFSLRSDASWWVRSNTTLEWDLSRLENVIGLDAYVFPYYGTEDAKNAMQGVKWTSSSAKVASVETDEAGKTRLVCHKTGTVTVTATATDGSGKKISFKVNLVKSVTELTIADQTLKSGKSLKLASLVTINPSDATNKKLNWQLIEGDAYSILSSSGVLKAKKVTEAQKVEIAVSSQDGGASTIFIVTIAP